MPDRVTSTPLPVRPEAPGRTGSAWCTHEKDQHIMATPDDSSQPSSRDHGPWWAAAVGGGGGITAAVLQDHAIAWAIVAAFAAWLAHNVIIAWLRGRTGKRSLVLAWRGQRSPRHRGPLRLATAMEPSESAERIICLPSAARHGPVALAAGVTPGRLVRRRGRAADHVGGPLGFRKQQGGRQCSAKGRNRGYLGSGSCATLFIGRLEP
jgi:hypothetical protein